MPTRQGEEWSAASAVTVGMPRLYTDRGWPAVAAPITINGQRHDVFFRASRPPLAENALPFVLTALVPAMKLGLPLRVEAPVPAQFLDFLPSVQALMRVWRTYLQPVSVEVLAGQPTAALYTPHDAQRGVGLFFSAGVDSFYSLLKHQSEITHLIFVHGFDTLLSQPDIRVRNAKALRQAAAEMNKPLIEVETNWREEVDGYVRWSHDTATVAQLSIAALLGTQLQKVYVAGNFDYFGEKHSHGIPAVLHTAGVDTVRDGMVCLRLDKMTVVASSDTAMRWLRVCWQNRSLAYNCGRCEKCLRTMIGLHLAGALGRCRTFQQSLDMERIRYLGLGDSAYFWPELLVELERRGNEPALTEVVRDCLHWSSAGFDGWDTMLAELERRGDMMAISDVVRECLRWAEAPAQQREHAARLRTALARQLELERELAIIKSSRSWKLTAPLRALGKGYRRLKIRMPGS
jgi:hypothetical protein